MVPGANAGANNPDPEQLRDIELPYPPSHGTMHLWVSRKGHMHRHSHRWSNRSKGYDVCFQHRASIEMFVQHWNEPPYPLAYTLDYWGQDPLGKVTPNQRSKKRVRMHLRPCQPIWRERTAKAEEKKSRHLVARSARITMTQDLTRISVDPGLGKLMLNSRLLHDYVSCFPAKLIKAELRCQSLRNARKQTRETADKTALEPWQADKAPRGESTFRTPYNVNSGICPLTPFGHGAQYPFAFPLS